ncbi:MAG: cell division protein ZapD [Cytophagales bacterium]|nr:cell division protein ZapD [Cytophagales bacterium]
MILYEHPFNERIRTYLRLEHLYARLEVLVDRETPIDHHYALATLFEIMDVAGRAELKTDVLKDLDKQKNALMSFRDNPAIDENVLNKVIGELDAAFAALSQTHGRVGGTLGENDWLMSVRSRVSIPGGTCSFDLPTYFAWQQLTAGMRRADIRPWVESVKPMKEAVALLLRLVRDSGTARKMVATAGHFQQYIPQGKPFQLVQILIDESLGVAPEVSVNRLLVTARFVAVSVNERSQQTSLDVAFELTLCH